MSERENGGTPARGGGEPRPDDEDPGVAILRLGRVTAQTQFMLQQAQGTAAHLQDLKQRCREQVARTREGLGRAQAALDRSRVLIAQNAGTIALEPRNPEP